MRPTNHDELSDAPASALKSAIRRVGFFLAVVVCVGGLAATFLYIRALAATAVPMASTTVYSENFADIANWTNNFAAGIGANRYSSITTGSFPSPTQTTVFSSSSTGGVQKGTGNIVLLATGATNNSDAAAFDLNLDFTGVNAGTISLNWAEITNGTGDRASTFKLQTNGGSGSTFTDLAGTSVVVTNSVASSGSLTNITLPAGFNNSSGAVVRFYIFNSGPGTSGSRPKISIDNVVVTVAQSSLKFRSAASGNWNANATWEMSADGTNWIAATQTPTSANDIITIRSPHNVTATANLSADQVTVDSGGQVTLAAAVDFGSASSTVNGTMSINSGGSVNTNPPKYGTGSTLVYSTGGTFTAGAEWTTNSSTTTDPGIPRNVTISSGTTLSFGTASSYRFMLNDLLISGTLALSTVSGGDIHLAGNWTNNGTFTHNGQVVVVNGSAAQTVGGSGTNAFATLLLNKNSASDVVTLTTDASISSTLNLSTGILNASTNNKTVSVTNSATNAVSGSASSYVDGKLERALPVILTSTTYAFPLGTTNGYSPLSLGITANTVANTFTASATQSSMPGISLPSKAITRYWTLASSGVGTLTSTPTFTYLDADVPGTSNEANYRIFKDTNGSAPFTFPDAGADDVNEGANTGTLLAPTTTYSNWSIGEPNAPTAVKLAGFNAAKSNNNVMLQWQTGYEVRNLGYNVYREQDGKRTRITPSLVAGSALLAGRQTALTAGFSYIWYDQLPTDSSGAVSYWLEDFDLSGARTLHGPIVPLVDGSSPKGARGLRSDLLSEVNLRTPSSGDQFSGWPAASSKQKSSVITGKAVSIASLQQQNDIAATAGVKFAVSKTGWYRVTQPELLAAGIDANVEASNLQLFANAQEVPIRVSGNGVQLTSSDYIEFFGKGLESTTDAKQAYYLIPGSGAGKRIGVLGNGGPLPPSSGPASYGYTIERKDRGVYFPGLLNGEAENIFGAIVSSTAASEVLSVKNVDASASGQGQLLISLVGLSQQAHHVQITLNGNDVGTIDFSNLEQPTQTFNIPPAFVHEGDNTVQLTSVGSGQDFSLVDTVRLTYAHTYTADSDSLQISVSNGGTTRVSGFTSGNIRVVDSTNPDSIQELTPVVTGQPDGSYAADMQVMGASSNQPHTLLVFADAMAGHPDAVKHNDPSTWHLNSNSADYLIITGHDFVASAQTLAQFRHNQGLAVKVIDVEDLYDEFSFGRHTPAAVHDFLQTAASTWSRAPRYLLLMGDASYDPKNYLGQGNTDFIPTKLLDTAQSETASDDWLADLNGDGVADLAIGRLPVRTAADANAMVNKIMTFENAPYDPQRGAVLVADRTFEGSSDAVKNALLSSLPVQTINRSSSDDGTIHNQILSSINQGPRFVNYLGHGSNGVWTGARLLSNPDAAVLANTDHPSVFVMMTCLNGYFQDAYSDSLSEALLRSQGGAVAVWASTGLTGTSGQNQIDQEFYHQVFASQARLGDAVRAAKATTSDSDVRRTWTLFGDPAMRLANASPTATIGTVGGIITDSQGAPLAGTTINLTGAKTRQTITDANGQYSFDNLDTNGFYTVTPSRANYTFSPAIRNFSSLGEHTDAAFTGIPDGGTSTNAIDSTEFFVRQQYVDFLSREPDEAGFNFWSDQVRSCGTDAACLEVKRINTSAAFFLSIEFQQTGYLVYRTYKSAYGNLPDAPVPIKLNEFLPDTSEIGRGVVVNQAGWEALLENNKQAFMAEFVQRPRFSSAYPMTMTPAEFVDQLFANAGVTPSGSDRAGAISEFGSATTTGDVAARARALRRVGENSTLAQRELNRAFVLTQYFGYLRRNPNDAPEASLDYSGYNFWLNKLNSFNGNFVNAEMVKAFLISGEYRQRFTR